MAEVKLVNIKKVYPFSGEKEKKRKKRDQAPEEKKSNLQVTEEGVVAVQEFNLDIANKEFIVLVGPSGCGKSTTLRMVAGLESISGGELYIDGELMNAVAPKVMLMDEPLSNLDAKLRNEMRAEIIKLRERIDTTFIYVTHDQTEAMTLGDRIVVMKDGYIQQIGTPQEVYNHPANLFVAGFIGMPVMNFYDAKLVREGDRYFVEVCGYRVELSAEKEERLAAKNVGTQEITLGVRPDHTDLTDEGIACKVDVMEMMGASAHLHASVDGRDVIVIVSTQGMKKIPQRGDEIHISFDGDVAHVFSKEDGKNLEY